MKQFIFMIMLALSAFPAISQDSLRRGQYLGIDVINSIPSFIFPDHYYIRNTIIVEPYYLLDLARPTRRLHTGAGFASGTTHQHNAFDPPQRFRGTYFRIAYEVKKAHKPLHALRLGYGPILSLAGYHGKFSFEGPTFGDYKGHFKETNNVALGIDGYFAYDFTLHKDWLLRLTLRNVVGLRGAASSYVQYFPGFGYTPPGFNNRLLYSGGMSLQIHYKIR